VVLNYFKQLSQNFILIQPEEMLQTDIVAFHLLSESLIKYKHIIRNNNSKHGWRAADSK